MMPDEWRTMDKKRGKMPRGRFIAGLMNDQSVAFGRERPSAEA